jgi:hypothetical protein
MQNDWRSRSKPEAALNARRRIAFRVMGLLDCLTQTLHRLCGLRALRSYFASTTPAFARRWRPGDQPEFSMAYLLLVIEPTHQRSERTDDEGRLRYEEMATYAESLKQRGVLLACESLKSASDGVRVEVRNGERRLLDGPFAEAKEMVGGFLLLNCDTREEAVAIATACPAARWCSVEVREIGPCYQ